MSEISIFEILATICFAIAIFHTFLVKKIHHFSTRFSKESISFKVIHLLSEVELVFAIWSLVFIFLSGLFLDTKVLVEYLSSRSYYEPFFVFVVMLLGSTKPVLQIVHSIIFFIGLTFEKAFHLPRAFCIYLAMLTMGPLLGSLVTEPAAMIVTAYFLLENFFNKGISEKFKYASLGLLFVNVSIGGVLTPYAAPPVVMVARIWNWDLNFMFINFGWKSILAIFISTSITVILFYKELIKIEIKDEIKIKKSLGQHFNEFLKSLKVGPPLYVGLFLLGLVILGGMQKWWLAPLITSMNSHLLYVGSAVLTSVTDNAALTYLGSQIVGLSDSAKYFLVAGSVVGGGLTIIANAPNPVGYSVLNSTFGVDGISPWRLFKAALVPTLIAFLIFLG
jgi:hypothetical protein